MRVDVGGYGIEYLTEGAGDRAVLLIHGHLQAAEDWFDDGYGALADHGFRVLALDLLGYGRSDKPHAAGAYGLDHTVAQVSAVLDAAGAERAVVWGYSLGGIVAEAFAKQQPARAEALVIGGQLVGLTPTDRANILLEGADLLEQVGVGRFVEETFPFTDAETRKLFVARNDAIAAAASVRACSHPHDAEDDPRPAATVNYVGTAEPWFEVAQAVAAQWDVPFFGVPDADHAQAFRQSEVVIPRVLGQLTSSG